ncbi:MAG TPA: hypothetical protein VHT96_16290 [Clostridia bacterium]|nr:hypothetical protein [Clostridia bacterium]
MGRLSLVLADGDTEYLGKLERYIIVNYPQRFDIISFASNEKLAGYLDSNGKADIMLVGKELMQVGPITANQAKTVILDGGGEKPVLPGYDTVEKYQHADRLVADILRLYAARGIVDCSIPGRHRTQVICVCSPCGGSGKSSIAAGCAVICESRGSRAFYLNLESVPSTEMFFHSEFPSEQSFSNVIYHLKGKYGNMGLKLEGASNMDSKTGVRYFRPPEKLSEMNELTEQDITLLLDTFKKSAAYDTVFVDTGSGFSQTNTAVMKLADVILLICTPGQGASVKYKEFIKAIEDIGDSCEARRNERLLPVLNRVVAGRDTISVFPGEFEPAAVIPECQGGEPGSGYQVLTENPAFLSGIGTLCGYVLPGRADTAHPGGGENLAV